jgi:glycerol-3-phosphate dehydrogenase
MLVEQDDLASATSQASSKLIHGGLRYLEHYEFKLVREALREREVLLRLCPHLVRPLNFVVPHDANQRPRWMIRTGLWLYDHLGGRETLPGLEGAHVPARGVQRRAEGRLPQGLRLFRLPRRRRAPRDRERHVGAREGRADPHAHALPRREARWHAWSVEIEDLATGMHRTIRASGLVNAAGPWVTQVLDHSRRTASRAACGS